MMPSTVSRCVIASIASACLLLQGCATTGPGADPSDPYIGYNQSVFKFNNGFYDYVATPINTVYITATPEFVRTGVGNALNNLGTVPDMMNDALQWNWRYFVKDTVRLVLNTTLGLFGLIDVAGAAGIPAHEQGFSYTLAKWGYVNSSYFMLPFFGPGTVSSALSLPVNYLMSPLTYINGGDWKYPLWGLEGVQTMYQQLPAYNTINATALNPYIAVRNAFLQNRAFVLQQIENDGVVPPPAANDMNAEVSPVLLEQMANS